MQGMAQRRPTSTRGTRRAGSGVVGQLLATKQRLLQLCAVVAELMSAGHRCNATAVIGRVTYNNTTGMLCCCRM